MKKTLFATILLLLLPLASRAQHFEWAKGFGGSTQGNGDCLIKGSVTDDEGNLYILGQFNVNDTWDNGPRLLPMAPYGPNPYTLNALIAKISPSGEMLWKKVIHKNNGSNSVVYDIKKVGDTAFACLLTFSMPLQTIEYTYYLDTLLTRWEDYPVPYNTGGCGRFTTWILFGFDGEVKEQHFLQYSLIDSAGNDDITTYPGMPDYFNSFWLDYPSFDVDSEGNIYIARQANDCGYSEDLTVASGAAIGIRFWVDRRCAGTIYPQGRPLQWYPHILKFSPHFDTLLADRYVIQKNTPTYQHNYINCNVKLDDNDNVYYLWNMTYNSGEGNDTMVVDSLQGISLFFRDYQIRTGHLVKFDANLTPQWAIELGDSIINPSTILTSTFFHDIVFDNDSNLFFLSATSGRGYAYDTIHFFSVPTYQGTPLDIKNEAFFMSFHNGSTQPELHSYGVAPAIIESDILYDAKGNLTCKGNRLFMQSRNIGGMRFLDRTIRFPQIHDPGLGFTVFDYAGNAITGYVYTTTALGNRPGPISLQDSVLYLMQTLVTDATFGDIHLSVNERMASIAKYVDPAFMTPYVSPVVNGIPPVGEGTLSVYPNPAHDVLHVTPLEEPLLGASAISVIGCREPLPLHGNSVDVSRLPPGVYLLSLETPTNTYHHKFLKL